jgi:plasmid stabilization system protein ParE
MNGRFRFTPEAEAQLAEIIDFVAADSEDAARRVLNGIYEALDKLAEMPEMGHVREDLTDRPLKFCGIYSYLIVYDPASSPLSVIAILRGSRDVEQILKNR